MNNIKLKKINILEPNMKIKIGVRIISREIPVTPVFGTAGFTILNANQAGNAIVGDATQIDE